MTQPFSQPERAALAVQTFSRVYRLALLVAGDQKTAAALTVETFTALSQDASDPERALARGLLTNGRRPATRERARWRPDHAAVDRAGIGADAAIKLLAVCRNASPEARLLFGLHTLWGLTPAEAVEVAGQPLELLIDLRTEATMALGLVSSDADRATVATVARLLAGALPPDEASAARGVLLSDAAVRAIRDGLLEGEQTIRRALPVLFAAPPPDDLLDRIEHALVDSAAPRAQVERRARRLSPTVKLTGAVLLLIGALLLVPMLWSWRAADQGATGSRPQTTASQLVEAAIHRFDQPTLKAGVLHEVQQGLLGDQTWRQERWYDFGSPTRLHVQITQADTLIYALAATGNNTVQYRQQMSNRGRGPVRGLTVNLSPDALQSAMPILRQQPDKGFFGVDLPQDLGRFYLAQARTATLTSQGTTTFLGRQAAMISYATDSALPTESSSDREQAGRVVLSIDIATNSLLDVTVLPTNAGASDTVLHPWQAQVFEVRDIAPDSAFVVPQTNSRERNGLPNPRAPFSFDRGLTSLEALVGGDQKLYIPEQLPDATSLGLVLDRTMANSEGPLLLYEGEFRSVVVLPSSTVDRSLQLDARLQKAGRFTYQLGTQNSGGSTPISVAVVNDPASGQQLARIYLLDQFATPAERSSALEQVVESLQPLTAQNVDLFSRSLYRPEAAGGVGQ